MVLHAQQSVNPACLGWIGNVFLCFYQVFQNLVLNPTLKRLHVCGVLVIQTNLYIFVLSSLHQDLIISSRLSPKLNLINPIFKGYGMTRFYFNANRSVEYKRQPVKTLSARHFMTKLIPCLPQLNPPLVTISYTVARTDALTDQLTARIACRLSRLCNDIHFAFNIR